MIGEERRFLLLHGADNWRPRGHWQWWLAEELRSRKEQVLYPQLPTPSAPNLAEWQRVLVAELEQLGRGERIVIAHSCSVPLWLLTAPEIAATQRVDRVLLVAPPGPSFFSAAYRGFMPTGFCAEAIADASRSTLVVASDRDPYCSEGLVCLEETYLSPAVLPVHVLPGTGHISLDDGFGPWPEVLRWCLDPTDGGGTFGAARVEGV